MQSRLSLPSSDLFAQWMDGEERIGSTQWRAIPSFLLGLVPTPNGAGYGP